MTLDYINNAPINCNSQDPIYCLSAPMALYFFIILIFLQIDWCFGVKWLGMYRNNFIVFDQKIDRRAPYRF